MKITLITGLIMILYVQSFKPTYQAFKQDRGKGYVLSFNLGAFEEIPKPTIGYSEWNLDYERSNKFGYYD